MHYLQWVKRIYPRKTLFSQVQCQIEQAEIQLSEPNMVTWCLKLRTVELTEN